MLAFKFSKAKYPNQWGNKHIVKKSLRYYSPTKGSKKNVHFHTQRHITVLNNKPLLNNLAWIEKLKKLECKVPLRSTGFTFKFMLHEFFY